MFAPPVVLGLAGVVLVLPFIGYHLLKPRLRRLAVEEMTNPQKSFLVAPLAVVGFVFLRLLGFFAAAAIAYSALYPAKLDLGLVHKVQLQISSIPEGRVSVNDHDYGVSPVTVAIHAGRHQVRISGINGYLPLDTVARVTSDWLLELKPLRAPIRKTVLDEPLAWVFGAPDESVEPITRIGKGAGLDILGQKNGWYEVRTADGREGWVRARATAEMTYATWFRSTPPGAAIYIDGKHQGSTPKSVPLKAGRYELRIGGVTGYKDASLSITVTSSGQTFTTTLERTAGADTRRPQPVTGGRPSEPVKPGPERVRFHSDPAGARVSINGTVRGTTPLDLSLEPGRYRVELHKEGYEPVTGAVVSISADGTRYFPFALKPVGK